MLPLTLLLPLLLLPSALSFLPPLPFLPSSIPPLSPLSPLSSSSPDFYSEAPPAVERVLPSTEAAERPLSESGEVEAADGDVDVSFDGTEFPPPSSPPTALSKLLSVPSAAKSSLASTASAVGDLPYPKLTVIAATFTAYSALSRSRAYYRTKYHKSEKERLEDFRRIMGPPGAKKKEEKGEERGPFDSIDVTPNSPSPSLSPSPPSPSPSPSIPSSPLPPSPSPPSPSPSPPRRPVIKLQKEIRSIDDLMASTPEERAAGRAPITFKTEAGSSSPETTAAAPSSPSPSPPSSFDEAELLEGIAPGATTTTEGNKIVESMKETVAAAAAPLEPAPLEPAAATATTKTSKLKSIFKKSSKPSRPSSLESLTGSLTSSPSTLSPSESFSRALAISLSFGALGRFPLLESLPDHPSSFSLSDSRENLSSLRTAAGFPDALAAETFAQVTSCMLTSLIDLASSALLEADKTMTVLALDIVLDFMAHASEIFTAVAGEGTAVSPVVYGGKINRGKLEDMYQAYVEDKGMSSDSEKVDQLQVVFDIKEAKAQAIQQKGMMASMMNMMKGEGGGEGMEELQEMMKGMKDMPGMEGGAGGGKGGAGMDYEKAMKEMKDGKMPEMSQKEIKESIKMMKQLIDGGMIGKNEIEQIKDDFKKNMGADVKELLEDAEELQKTGELDEDGTELLELFRTVLDM